MISGSTSSLHSGALSSSLLCVGWQLVRLRDQRGNHLLSVRGPEAALAVDAAGSNGPGVQTAEEDEIAAGGREPTGQRGGLGAQRGVGEQGEGQPTARGLRARRQVAVPALQDRGAVPELVEVALLPRAGPPRGLSVRYPPPETPLMVDALSRRGAGAGVDPRPGRRRGLSWEWAPCCVVWSEPDMLFGHRGGDLHVDASHAP